MKVIIFSLILLYSLIMVGVGIAYSNALTIIGALLLFSAFLIPMREAIKNKIEQRYHIKLW